jgi:hypothetical protein
MTKEVQFDPGFIQHISAFIPNIEYVYNSLAHFKNFNQKKQQFKMYYPKIQSLLKNYLGFYMGCMLWAAYIKQFDGANILNNLCFGGEYNETETLSEVDFIFEYIEQLKKDAKYYTGQDFVPETIWTKIINTYKDFLQLNKGFVNTKTTNDVQLPKNLIVSDLDEIYNAIEKVIENGKLNELLPLAQKVL